MLTKYLGLLLLAQFVLAAPSQPSQESLDLNDPVQRDLQQKAKEESVHLLDSLFRSQIAYFTEVKSHLGPQTKRFRDITLYLTRLNQAVAQKDLETKEKIWFNVFEEFKESPLLLNRESETNLSDVQYKLLLTGKKLQDISSQFIADVGGYVWKMAKFSGQVVENHIDGLSKASQT
ncbi:uncharacterized protein Dana_GF15616 [Drosophila ananassae]|uniref:Uncharacterized protein n=1 Tax=Drosophila ananassae TaxID=7217 RepID=B3MN15_DROAN|nr:uncharacterized protein LOC6498422 [Drosophila ananassae]EDV31993.1 uncharacterized protein Dana_GF15616 [Drosophila ananassae]